MAERDRQISIHCKRKSAFKLWFAFHWISPRECRIITITVEHLQHSQWRVSTDLDGTFKAAHILLQLPVLHLSRSQSLLPAHHRIRDPATPWLILFLSHPSKVGVCRLNVCGLLWIDVMPCSLWQTKKGRINFEWLPLRGIVWRNYLGLEFGDI